MQNRNDFFNLKCCHCRDNYKSFFDCVRMTTIQKKWFNNFCVNYVYSKQLNRCFFRALFFDQRLQIMKIFNLFIKLISFELITQFQTSQQIDYLLLSRVLSAIALSINFINIFEFITVRFLNFIERHQYSFVSTHLNHCDFLILRIAVFELDAMRRNMITCLKTFKREKYDKWS